MIVAIPITCNVLDILEPAGVPGDVVTIAIACRVFTLLGVRIIFAETHVGLGYVPGEHQADGFLFAGLQFEWHEERRPGASSGNRGIIEKPGLLNILPGQGKRIPPAAFEPAMIDNGAIIVDEKGKGAQVLRIFLGAFLMKDEAVPDRQDRIFLSADLHEVFRVVRKNRLDGIGRRIHKMIFQCADG